VAVKVQYPGVARAVRADLQNLGLLMRVAKRIAPGMDVKAMTAEIKERLSDELDYEQEAQAQRAMARAWRGHPFVVIPDVVTSLSSERVLVTEWLEGRSFEEVRKLPDADRDRFGEIVFRFFSGSLYRNGHFSGDPHPGNYRLMDDGRVAFLDFGMTKHVDRAHVEREIAVLRAGMDGDAVALRAALTAAGYYAPGDPEVSADAVLAHFRDIASWYLEDRKVTIDRELVTQVLIDSGDPRSPHWELMKRGTVPADAMLARRMEGLVLGVLGHLRVTANWHLIAREWLFGDPPSTPLGELEADYFDGRSAAA
jgi:predicted unusual protein kinase regulating ubiquinone biosynthesis (AarF/ABC1/UbiB family)